jgi:hypothetical protein
MPAAHALQQCLEDVERVAGSLGPDELWARPGGVASLGFHLRHLAGSIDRLLTYAAGRPLDDAQLGALSAEHGPPLPDESSASLVARVRAAIERAMSVYRATDPTTLLDPRDVGRAKLPSNVIGLLFHIAEHSQRHAGAIVQARAIKG